MLGTYHSKVKRGDVWFIVYDTLSSGSGMERSERREHQCNAPATVDGQLRSGCQFFLNGQPCELSAFKMGDRIEIDGKPAVSVKATRK